MSDYAKTVLVVLLGFSIFISSIAYLDRAEEQQKFDNIERMYRLKAELKQFKNSQETEKYIKDCQKYIDSLEYLTIK